MKTGQSAPLSRDTNSDLAKARFREKGKSKGRQKKTRDAAQILAAQGIEESLTFVSSDGTSVTAPTLHSSKASRTYKQAARRHDGLSYRKHRVPASWEELSDLGRSHWLNRAVAIEGGRSMTINFSPEEEEELRTCDGAVDRFRRRMAYHLKTALGFEPPFWIRLELTHGYRGRLHVHGGIILPFDDTHLLAKARKALRKAAGEWRRASQHQVKFGRDRPDDAWATYTQKEAVMIRSGGIIERHVGRSFQGSPTYASNKMKHLAEAFYMQWRATIMKEIH